MSALLEDIELETATDDDGEPIAVQGEPRSKKKSKKIYDLGVIIKLLPKLLGTFRLNQMTNQPELNGKEVAFEPLRGHLAIMGYEMSSTDVRDAVNYLSSLNSYHPVRDYLDTLTLLYTDSDELQNALSTISTRYLGTNNPLYDVYIRKQLIAAVNRVYDPGCLVKTVVVLTGAQNAGKSKFLRTLASPQWFDDSLDPTDKGKDTKAKINRYLIHEIPEIDQYTRKADEAALKAMISSPSDNYRIPYGITEKTNPRTSTFWATANETSLLKDSTGSVRFWCIDIGKSSGGIDVKKLASERDTIWAAACYAYLKGEQYWLTLDEEHLQSENNEKFKDRDPWYEVVKDTIGQYKSLPLKCLYPRLGITNEKISKQVQVRLISVLRDLGWVYDKKMVRVGKSTFNVWVNPDQTAEFDLRQAIYEYDRACGVTTLPISQAMLKNYTVEELITTPTPLIINTQTPAVEVITPIIITTPAPTPIIETPAPAPTPAVEAPTPIIETPAPAQTLVDEDEDDDDCFNLDACTSNDPDELSIENPYLGKDFDEPF